MENAEKVLYSLSSALQRAKTAGLSDTEINKCLQDEGLLTPPATSADSSGKDKVIYQMGCKILNIFLFKVYPLIFLLSLLAYPLFKLFAGSPCLLTEITPFAELFMPFVNCDICNGVTEAPRLVNLSQEEFIRKYAYNSKPIVVVGAASDWPALNTFSYDYFKDLYLSMPGALQADNTRGQFFAYSSSIQNLQDLFELPSEIASMSKEKWYIGWSTFDPNIGSELYKHIKTPPFIPPSLNEPQLAWIFMGSPGPGASIHVDMVELASWQAQLSGTKIWTLTPPPECEHVCTSFNVTVNRGDIFVVDTNRWYHQTYILPGNISITIGTEYH